MGEQIYVETRVHADLDVLWQRTQDAAQHTRWDVRFHEITDLAPRVEGEPKGFTYALHLPSPSLRLRTVAGTGVSVGERWRPDGSCTSALRFSSPDPLSLIRSGSGWWRYVPTEGPDAPDAGVRFLTGYDYEPGWGAAGRLVDRVVFRRLLGWGTAWSFDRLRIWLEDDVPPEAALRRALADAGVRAGVVVLAAVAVRRSPRRSALPAAAALLAALRTPAPAGVPRAGRCLRRPPDRLARRAPGLTARLDDAPSDRPSEHSSNRSSDPREAP